MSRTLRQRGGAGESALPVRRRGGSSAFDRIAPAVPVLLDEAGSATGILARRRRGRTEQDLDYPVRHSEQAKTEPSTKIAKPGVAFTPFSARGEASSQPDFVAGGGAVDPLQDEFEVEGQFEFADHDDRGAVALQRQQIAASDFALDDEAEPFEEDLDRPIE